jgi:hypothetical protein
VVIFRGNRREARYFSPDVSTQVELDIMREKADALGRAGGKLDELLRGLRDLEEQIKCLETDEKGAKEVKPLIEEFNQVCEKASKYLHYFIIHREAIGFRRHTNIENIYRIPSKKRLLTGKNVR